MSSKNKKIKERFETVLASIEKEYGSLHKLKDQSNKYVYLRKDYKRQRMKYDILDKEHLLLKKSYLDFRKHGYALSKL